MNYVDWEYIGTKGCYFQLLALRSSVKSPMECGRCCGHTKPLSTSARETHGHLCLTYLERDDTTNRQRSGTAETDKTERRMYIYVQAQDGTPLMPTQRAGKVRRMLRDGQAVIVSHTPFTIRLTYETTRFTQPVSLGVDAGCSTSCKTTGNTPMSMADVVPGISSSRTSTEIRSQIP